MNLKALQHTDVTDIQLVLPGSEEPLLTPEGEPIVITAKGAESKAFRAAARRIQEASGASRKRLKVADQERNRVELIASVTVGWSGISVDESEELMEFSHENAVRLYTELPWVLEQVDIAIAERQRFFKNADPS